MAPPGRSRRTLARDLAGRCGGRVHPVWHHDSEPSLVPGLGRFLHLTQGFEVRRPGGALLCSLVDDVTLLAGLDPRAPAPPGWFRILGDDPRLLSLLAAHSDPGGTLGAALDAPAQLWGRRVERHGDVYRLDDVSGATIALAAPQGGERERPCEIVTPPLSSDHGAALEELLGPARELGFTVPREAAVHLHIDGAPFREPHALANVVRLFAHWREPLRLLLGTNPACRRLAPAAGAAGRGGRRAALHRRPAQGRGRGRAEQVLRRQPHPAAHRHPGAGHHRDPHPARRADRRRRPEPGRAGRAAAGPLRGPGAGAGAPGRSGRRGRGAAAPGRARAGRARGRRVTVSRARPTAARRS
ncbi:amidoligase family protein [Actinoplanes nipponensis]|uniref:amidoligase family protein n=1 Tax=Actinoplanes nipponensis TaxID=135950 RepID=UPI0031F01595